MLDFFKCSFFALFNLTFYFTVMFMNVIYLKENNSVSCFYL